MNQVLINIFRMPGSWILDFIMHLGRVTLLSMQSIYWMFRGKIFRNHFWNTLNMVGVQSLPLISFTALFSGMVLVVQVGNQFMDLGAESYIGGVVGLSLTRELSPLMVSIILAARIGSSMAAELGTMKVTEQVDALEVMATNPVQYLVVPRVLACCFFTPVLVIYSNVVGICGGWAVAIGQIGVNHSLFVESLIQMVSNYDFFSGLLKSIAFGFIVAIIGCYKGLSTAGGAKGVGTSTTQSVVIIITSILVFNYFFSLAFFTYLRLIGRM